MIEEYPDFITEYYDKCTDDSFAEMITERRDQSFETLADLIIRELDPYFFRVYRKYQSREKAEARAEHIKKVFGKGPADSEIRGLLIRKKRQKVLDEIRRDLSSRENIIKMAAGVENYDNAPLNYLIGIARLGTEYSEENKRNELVFPVISSEEDRIQFNEETERALKLLGSHKLDTLKLAEKVPVKEGSLNDQSLLWRYIYTDRNKKYTVDELASLALEKATKSELGEFSILRQPEEEKKLREAVKPKRPSYKERLEASLLKPADNKNSGRKPFGSVRHAEVSPETAESGKKEGWAACLPIVRDFLNSHALGTDRTDNICRRLIDLAAAAHEKGREKDSLRAYDRIMSEIDFSEADSLKTKADRSGERTAAAVLTREQHRLMRELIRITEEVAGECLEKEDEKFFRLSEKYAGLYNTLTSKVAGQDAAVNELVQTCFQAELMGVKKDVPQAVFLFAGPPGVGKTFLAKSAAEVLGRPFKTYDMATYAAEKSELDLFGSEPLFKNAMEGTLVSFVEDNPDAVILFDEIEKASSEVTKQFLSVLDGARMRNAYTSADTDFSGTILIFTTNAGRELYDGTSGKIPALSSQVIVRELQKEKDIDGRPTLSPELCSRLAGQHIVLFNHIGISDISQLVKQSMDEDCAVLGKSMKIDIGYDDRLPLLLIMHFGITDVRMIVSKAGQFIRDEIYELSRQVISRSEAKTFNSLYFALDDERLNASAAAFFRTEEDYRIGVVCSEESREKFKNCKGIVFLNSEANLIEYDLSEFAAILVDPYYEMRRTDSKILGLEDYDSEGLRIIKKLLQKGNKVPVYLLESGKKISRADRTGFYERGVEDTASLLEDTAQNLITGIARKQLLQKKAEALLSHRKIFSFESLQKLPDENGCIRILFYDITVQDVVDAEDADSLVDIDEKPEERFEDVIGAENAKDELRDFLGYLKDPRGYMKKSLSVPKGVLLYGPPGTGKTMLARAMAGEAGSSFIAVSAAELLIGNAEYNIKKLFERARKYAPSIVFIDEADAIAKRRVGGPADALLNLFLTEMDGFDRHADQPVFIIAATNFGADDYNGSVTGGLDPAFLRRFGNRILVDKPNRKEREEYLHLRLKRGGRKVPENRVTDGGIGDIAERTGGSTPAELENILALAFRNAARKGVLLDDPLLDEALEEYFYGEKREIDQDDMYRTAVHEASHAYICSLSGKTVSYLTVTSRGNFQGYMQKNEESGSQSREDLQWYIRTALAGRVGEKAFFGEKEALNTGASSDLEQASYYAMLMLTSFGMEKDHLLTISQEALMHSPLASEYTAMANRILTEEQEVCTELITAGKRKIEELANALAERSHLNQREIAAILKGEE